jgi:uncharacterized protein (TIGR03086 family)
VLSPAVHHPAGDLPGQLLGGMRVNDLAIHAWDLARAMGRDETLDPELVEWCWAMMSPYKAHLSAGGYYQAPREVPAAATTQDRLLHLVGRSP